jgi:hypothetical protein
MGRTKAGAIAAAIKRGGNSAKFIIYDGHGKRTRERLGTLRLKLFHFNILWVNSRACWVQVCCRTLAPPDSTQLPVVLFFSDPGLPPGSAPATGPALRANRRGGVYPAI